MSDSDDINKAILKRTKLELVNEEDKLPLVDVHKTHFIKDVEGSHVGDALGAAFEEKFVHNVYDKIAPHFSATRYKPWTKVKNFIDSFNEHSIWADVGCGNGKYLLSSLDIDIANTTTSIKSRYGVGSDFSRGLIEICKERSFECNLSDCLSIPYCDGKFDNAISIAVIHHISTPERRLKALQELGRILTIGGRMLVFVWAVEQQKFKDLQEKVISTQDGDVFVPWNYNTRFNDPLKTEKGSTVLFQRYYHLFKQGELDELVQKISYLKIVETGSDSGNHYLIAEKIDAS